MIEEKNSKNYVYIEVLRQVCPIHQDVDFHYFLLGGFDAMKIHFGDSISALKKEYEKGQNSAPSQFDRQPLFLYTNQCMDSVNTEGSIFRNSDGYQNRPLVITLFQLDKARVAQQNGCDSPSGLIKEFEKLIAGTMDEHPCTAEQISYQVFWNLGESDITVIFRPTTLYQLAGILHDLRTENYNNSDLIRIVSTCSHCAFPKPMGLEGLSDSEKEKTILELLNNWLKSEFKINENSHFITLVNTSFEYNQVGSDAKFLFGEWDYMYQNGKADIDKLADLLGKIFSFLMKSNDTDSGMYPFRISYTIPALPMSGITQGKPKNPEANPYDEQWIIELSQSMDSLGKKAHNMFISDSHGTELFETIESFKCSIIGLAKFLYRLKVGRFEEDLYKYVKPIFLRLKVITENFTENINSLEAENAWKEIDILINEYITNTSELIESLQHLFSIMAVSPHTFMETYGSNMRSLSASDKLLDAYQGIICFLKKNFPDIIQVDDGKNYSTQRDVLVLPYRKAQSAHKLLYQQSSPRNRISYIQIDFTKMFDLKSTVFMLLHECGHHLSDRLRCERFDYLVKSAICMTFEWIGIGNFVYEPMDALVARLNRNPSRQARIREKGNLFFGLNTDIELKYKQKIRDNAQEAIRELAEFYCKDVKGNYLNQGPEYQFLKELHNNFFGRQVVFFLCKRFIPTLFGFTLNGDTSIRQTELCDAQQQKMIQDIKKTLGESFAGIACEMSEEIIRHSGNVREALRLKTIYSDKNLLAKNLFEGGIHIIKENLENNSLNELYSVFSNIYSDIFAICILDIELEEYIEIIPTLLGIEKNSILNDTSSLFRVNIVLDTLWPHQADEEEICSWLCKDPSMEEEFYKKWRNFKNASYRCYLEGYAKKCKGRMEELIQTTKKSMDVKSIEHLHNMFDGDSKSKIDAVYYFCQYLMLWEGESCDLYKKS